MLKKTSLVFLFFRDVAILVIQFFIIIAQGSKLVDARTRRK